MMSSSHRGSLCFSVPGCRRDSHSCSRQRGGDSRQPAAVEDLTQTCQLCPGSHLAQLHAGFGGHGPASYSYLSLLICRCTASRPSPCSLTSCTRRWRAPSLRQTAGSGQTYGPWRTVTSVRSAVVVCIYLFIYFFEAQGCEGMEVATSLDYLSPFTQTLLAKRRRGWRRSREPHAKRWPSVARSGRRGEIPSSNVQCLSLSN